MLRMFFIFLYNVLFVPVMFLGIHIVALFHSKLRRGLLGRYRIYRDLRKLRPPLNGGPVMVVHCASMGEFEHIKPFLLEFKKMRPDYRILVLFFSPSGYENVRSFPAVDLFLYTPFDWFLSVWRFIRRVKPSLWVVAKHDVWPNQVWIARMHRIPIFLINASLHQQSSRLLRYTRTFHQSVYGNFTRILTISENDRHHFLKLTEPEKITVVGDTKYDQVLYRRDESLKKKIIDPALLAHRWVLVAGSTWPEDQQHLIPAVKSLTRRYPQFLTIFCPHEPTASHIDQLQKSLQPMKTILLSEISNYSGEPFIIVDRVGVLANLYSLGKVGYVGGSFRQNIHNALEPAVYGIPVLFGPVNRNSHAAQLLKAEGGAVEVRSAEEIEHVLEKFIRNDIYRRETGKKAFQVVEENRGATRRTIDIILAETGPEKQTANAKTITE